MKNISITIIALIAMVLGLSNTVFSQEKIKTKKVVSDTILVKGVCDMCKERIENAALIRGVKKAEWNKFEQQLIVYYKPEKVESDAIEKEIAKAGHDTENHKARENDYARLPDCCAYRSDEIKVH
jgi:mercuric ion binding protein